MDWASIDQVSALVSRTTLAGMQQLWRQHASSMDAHGRRFSDSMVSSHTQAVKVSLRPVVRGGDEHVEITQLHTTMEREASPSMHVAFTD